MRRLMVHIVYCAMLSGFFIPVAQAYGSASAAADSTAAYESKHYPILQVPQFLWMGLLYPLGEFTIYAEHTRLPQRVYN